MHPTPFTVPAHIAPLYATPSRLTRRTGALHAAKISGADATTTIIEIAGRVAPARPTTCDIGCGRGTTSLALAAQLHPDRLIALDHSAALLHTVGQRASQAGHRVATLRADFHRLPFAPASIDVAVAAFCLYHSPTPDQVIAEIARCLVPGGHAVLVTKSADSYHEIDQLLQDLRLDPTATTRPSLYGSFHSRNAPAITATALRVVEVSHQHHVFRFTGRDHLAAYVATSPKYAMPWHDDDPALADQLKRRIPDVALTATSTVTYITATTP